MHTSKLAKTAGWTRREFMRAAAGVLALPQLRFETAGEPQRQFAYVAGGPVAGKDAGSICVLSSRAAAATSLIQRVPSAAPAYLLHAPAQQMLYVANDIKVHEGVSRGTVEAFRIDRADGTLSLLARTPLSLSATHPRHLALSPDGEWLAVAAYGGGIYNLLPVAQDGSLGAPRGIFKDTGCGPDSALQASAHPHTLFFDDSGRHLLSSDAGGDRISVFAVDNGRLTRIAKRFTGSGSGPGACVLHPAGFLYTDHGLRSTIGTYRFDPATGAISEQLHEVAASRSSTRCLALHPSGRALYASGEQLNVWQVDAHSGRLTHPRTVSLGQRGPSHISVARDGQSVYILDSHRGSVIQFTADPMTGELLAAASVAALHAPRSIAVRVI